ncbi:MAG TPA: orotate phosphoribosyltransferase [Vicinamibacteria bacterium]|jgi:orotate phosphoribosyltransferase
MLRAMGEKVAYRERFIDLLAENDVIRFGDFTLKSGRKSPYFVNAGQLRTGRAIAGVGRAYAERIREAGLSPDVIFGPAYKGVPLAVATAIALSERGQDVGFCFDRKEAKDHGEGGHFVGTQPAPGQGVVLVDDVITSGISIEGSVSLLRKAAAVRILGVVVAVDRQEKGRERSTLEELQESLGAPVLPVTSVRDVVSYLSSTGKLPADRKAAIEEYLGLYGAP